MKEVLDQTFEQNNKFEITPVSLDEWELYKELRLNALSSDPQAFGASFENAVNRTEEEWKESIKRCKEDKNALYVARNDKGYIGMIGYFPKEEGTVNIYGVYVKKEYRGQGVSDKIMETLLDSLDKDDSIKNVVLGVNKKQKAAIDFYKRFGFEEVEEIKDVEMGNGELCDELVMKKEIK